MERKITILKSITFTLVFLLCGFTYAQERTCGMVEHMQEQMSDPDYAEQYYKTQERFKKELRKTLSENYRVQPFVLIPVAVHFPNGNEADRACLEALAQNQIDILNDDYSATNADISQWASASSNYPGVNTGVANISFCLATMNHPAGTDPDLVEGGPAVTIGYNFGGGGDQDTNWSGYMNFLVKNIGGGILGYSPLGGSVTAGQSVVITNSAFGSGSGCTGFVPGAPYNLGRTVTHELGHFYNLNHTFTGSCDSDDGLADTPNIDSPNYGCPSAGSIDACVTGEKALTMSYMDYTNDACMYMFTAGQSNVVDAYMNILTTQFNSDTASCNLEPEFRLSANNSPLSVCSTSAVFDLNYTSIGGFSENTTFSVSGTPAGASTTFNPTSMNDTGGFTLTVNNLGAVADGDYPMTITGTSATLIVDLDVMLTITNNVCPSVANTDYLTSTEGVVFNTINNLNTGKPSGYSDYTAITTDVNRESSYDLTVYANSDGNYQIITYVWIDWNQNCSFDDAGEQYDLGQSADIVNDPTANSPLSVTIPNEALLGNTTMRVTTKYTDPNANQFPTSCEMGHDAEVEDYTINVLTSLSVDEFSIDSFVIYPNPNNGEFTVKLNSSSNTINVTVYDIRGRQIYENTFDNASSFNQTINIGSVQSGMYLVKVRDGIKEAFKKIIVE